MTIPNLLTSLRLCLMPVFLLVYFSPGPNAKWWAMGVIIFAFITDVLDGWIARKFNQISNLGKILDPIADKTMQLTVMLCIALNDPALWWVVIALFCKEAALGIGALLLYRRGIVGQANWFGKVACFASVFISIILLIPFAEPLPQLWVILLAGFLLLINVIALVSYAIPFFRVMTKKSE